MSGTAAVIAAEIGKGALAAIGSEAMSSFLGTDGTGEELKRLNRIEELLEQLHLKVDHLILMVAEIPELVDEAVNHRDLDRRWAYLESDYDNQNDAVGNSHAPPPESVENSLRHSWLVIVDYENRPALLRQLPFWTEYLRFRLKIARGSHTELHEDVEEKIQDLDDCIKHSTEVIDGLFKRAERLLVQKYTGSSPNDKANEKRYVSSGKTLNSFPYVVWKKAKDVKVRKSNPGPFSGYSHKKHKKFARRRDSVDRELKAIRERLKTEIGKLSSMIPVKAILVQYAEWLAGASGNETPN